MIIAMIGELNRGRKARPLTQSLCKFDRVWIFFVSPLDLQMKDDILGGLEIHTAWYSLEEAGQVRQT